MSSALTAGKHSWSIDAESTIDAVSTPAQADTAPEQSWPCALLPEGGASVAAESYPAYTLPGAVWYGPAERLFGGAVGGGVGGGVGGRFDGLKVVVIGLVVAAASARSAAWPAQ